MPRTFVVIGKAATVMADLSGSLFKIDKLVGTPRCGVRTAQRAVPTRHEIQDRAGFAPGRA